MKRKSRGQSLVEFALIFPVLMALLFGAIDLGYYVFIWSEVQFSARRSAEQATKLQPRELRQPTGYHNVAYIGTDPCLEAIFSEAQRSGYINGDTRVDPADVFLTFHATSGTVAGRTDANSKFVGQVIQVRVHKEVTPLTPLTTWMMGGRDFKFNATSRRTIVANGPSYTMRGPNGENYNTCTK